MGISGRFLLAGLSLLLLAARPGEPFTPLDIYGSDTRFFRQHRVREIVVLEQGYYKGELSGTRRALSVRQLDRQGRILKEWKYPSQQRFSTLEESTYDAAGHLTDRTSYLNESPATDTSRLGTIWRPDTRAHFAFAPGQVGYAERWSRQTHQWQRTEATRCWLAHDTTYLRSTRLPDGSCGNLLRSYPAPGGRTRRDYLFTGYCFLNDMVPFPPDYSYERQEGGRLLELGQLNFDEALRDYLRQHPAIPTPAEGTHAYSDLLDYVAHHAAGRVETLATRSYDSQGRLLVEAAKFSRTTYERNSQGQATAVVLYSHPASDVAPILIDRTTFAYQPDGLVAREEVTEGTLGLAAIRYYRYRYY